MIESSYAVYGTFIVYLILMLGIGLYAYRRTASSSDYFLGGRSLGPWPAALSAGASDMSGWLLLFHASGERHLPSDHCRHLAGRHLGRNHEYS